MKISVTQEHIDNGKPSTPSCCPVSLALRAVTGRAVFVFRNAIDICDQEQDFKTIKFISFLPEKVSEFIYKFDQNQKIEPFEFEIDL